MTGRRLEAITLGLAGAVLGSLVAAVLYFRTPAPGGTTYHGRYVPLHGLELSKAYASSLDISFYGDDGRQWFPQLPIAVGIGVLVGLAVFGVLVLTKRRIALVSGSSPTG